MNAIRCGRLILIALFAMVAGLPGPALAGALLDDIRRELPLDLTEPVILRQEGVFIADRQPIRDPGLPSGVNKRLQKVIEVKETPVGKIVSILGENFGAVIRIRASGYVGSLVSAESGPTEFEAKIPIAVKVQLPAPNTVAPAQYFNIHL